MERYGLALIFSALFSTGLFAQEEDKGVWQYYFRVVPEEQAHSYQGTAGRRELNPRSIKTFIWNIKKAERSNWKKEFDTYTKGHDLILLQEAYKNSVFNESINAFKNFRWDMGITMFYVRDRQTPTGTMIGSNVRPTEVVVKHSPDTEVVVKTPKSMTFAKYPIKDSPHELLAISIHGININDYGAYSRHINQAVDMIKEHQGPVLFAGDFNTRTQSRTALMMKITSQLKLKPVTFKNGNYRMRWKLTNNYLDHSFVRGLKVKEAVVIPDSFGSDHKPMLIELEVED